jgi:hypothetical protein
LTIVLVLHTHNIKLFVLAIGSNDANLGIQLKTGGTIYSTGNQRRQYTFADSTSITSGRVTSETRLTVGTLTSNVESCGVVEIMNPFQSTPTTLNSLYSFRPIGGIIWEYDTNGIPTSTSYDGFRLLPGAGTITGEIYVYGYVNS